MARSKLVKASGTPRKGGAAKRFSVANRVYIGLDVVAPAEREAVRGALASWADFRTVAKSARAVGSEAQLRLARVTPSLRLVFRETPTQVEVLDLVSARTLDAFGVKPVKVKKSRGRAKYVGPERGDW
jgi:hypothetical protein